MSESAPSSNTTTTTGRPSRTAVSSSAAAIMKPPSPVKARTRRSGYTSCAAMAAGSAKPMVASPFEITNSPGLTACQKLVAANMCAPESTVATVPAGVSSRAISTTRCGASPGPVPDTARRASVSRFSRSSSATSQSARSRSRSRGASSSRISSISPTTSTSGRK
jgi:hypothetical protein